MDSPLKLIVISISAVIVIGIIYNFFINQTQEAGREIKKGIEYAESNLNTLTTKQIKFKKNEAYDAKIFEEAGRNVRFKCSSMETCVGEKLKITTKQIQAKDDYYVNTYFRCVDKKVMNDCVVYFGHEPANLQIERIILPEETEKNNEVNLEFAITNKGETPSAMINYEIKVFVERKENNEKKSILKQNYQGSIEELKAKESKTIKQKITLTYAGNYTIEIVAENEEAGVSKVRKMLLVKESDNNCKATIKGESVLVEGKCKTPYYCENCEFAYQCSAKWVEKGIIATEIYKEVVYEEKEAENGKCK